MATILALLVLGVVYGCIYAMTATGLVVTYTTSGIFNFAHGAIGMVGAFTYWQLTVGWGWHPLIALPAVLLVGAPLFGAIIERVLMRPLHGASVDLTLVITLGLLLFLLGAANYIWPPNEARSLPPFLNSWKPLRFGLLTVGWGQVLVVVVALGVALALRTLFNQTRIGIAMRGVVDDPELAAMTGISPARVQQLSWALGASLAALAGILLAPIVTLSSLTLTLLVINGYAAALFGRLKSLPRTAVGALVLGQLIAFYPTYVAPNIPFFTGTFEQLEPAVPMIFLFVLLLLVPAARLRTSSAAGRATPTVPGLRQSLISAVGLFVVAAVLAQTLSAGNLVVGSRMFILGLTMLSLVLLVGYSGQTSLSHLTFVGLGAYAMGSWSDGSVLGLVYATLLAAAAGTVVALFSARLRGLYLALATFAFAKGMDESFFRFHLGSGGQLEVQRVHLPGIPTDSGPSFFLFTAALFCLAAVGLLAIRRGRWGRQLTALNDSPAACATLGINTTVTKVVVFAVSAGLAGFAGALAGGLQGLVGPFDFNVLGSLALLLALRVGGVNTITGALFAAYSIATFPLLQEHVPARVQIAYLLTGLTAVVVGRYADGIGGVVSKVGERVRQQLRTAPTPPGAPMADLEEAQLVRS
jgi:branched-chain amino acid transport system permease protein